MNARPWYQAPPTGGCLRWRLYVLASHKEALGHMEGDYVVDDFGNLVQLTEHYGFSVDGLHEVDDECLWLYWPHTVLEAYGHRKPGQPAPAATPPAEPPAPVALSTPQVRVLARFRRKLERWELPHLRALAARQAEQIEELQAQLDAMTSRCYDAEASLDTWHHHAMELGDALRESGTGSVGLTRAGQLLVLPAQSEARPS